MTVEVQGKQLFASGALGDDYLKFKELLRNPELDTVVFYDSPGGNGWEGMQIARLIEGRGLNTVVAGTCASACAIMFMGGRERRFSDLERPSRTYIGIHGGHDPETKRVMPQGSQSIFAFFKERMGERFDAAIMNRALYDMTDAGALLVVHDPVRAPKPAPYYCPSMYTPRDKCERFATADAKSLGIVTHDDLVKVTLPASMQRAQALWGVPLERREASRADYAAEVAARHCQKTPTCPAARLVSEGKSHLGVAESLDGASLSVIENAERPGDAILRAVAACNHPRGSKPRLCRAAALDDFDLRPWNQKIQAQHREAASRLAVPAEATFGNEEYGGIGTASTIKVEVGPGITPPRVEGAETITTQALARLMTGATPPTIVNVGLAALGLPGAHTSSLGGRAFADETQEKAQEAKFANLLALLAPDKDAPLVFYADTRESFASVNAVLRARRAGYTKLLWYRGGLTSWVAAGLPTATVDIRAVVL